MISVIATIDLNPGTRDAFLAEFHQIVPLVRAEQGCLEYFPAIDLASEIGAQPPVREHTVTVVEKWESLDALRAHLIAPHMVAYRPKVKDFVVKTTIQVLSPA